MADKISIITVNYNNRQGLLKTIDSVKRQTIKDFEFIIIDGGSTDGSEEIIRSEFSLFNYAVIESDNGVYHAMNKGIKASKGSYLLFLNSGDSLFNDHTLEKISPELNDINSIVYGDAAYQENTGEVIRTYPDKLSFSYFMEHSLSHQASFIKRSLFEDFFYYNENYKIVSDWEFFIYTICKENVVYKHVNQTICNYDTQGISSILENHKLMHQERNAVISQHFALFVDDYASIKELKSKRIRQYFYIREYKLAYKLLKAFMNFILVFLPKQY
ncbi:glycosyltransferase family 2 protein [Pedobacter sp. MW01-1-1]|uniref:glycosyltransferase family 2 protein n=1 Tax=Pedobacter sp. MW01-1-1 TaxID=3383027 RepID=UPI003FEF0592